MATKHVLVVFGSTGKQGGSVVKNILGDPKTKEAFHVRGITRDVSKDSAKALESMGAEMVAADLNNPSSLKAAVKGAYAIFAVTNFWESKNPEVEIAQGKAIANAAKEAGVQHFVWSSLINVRELSKGVLSNVKHFDSKAAVEAHIRELGMPTTFFLPGYYMSNLPEGAFRPGPNNAWTLSLPIPSKSQIPLFATVDDTGKFVKGILLNREKTLGKRIYGATDYYTPNQILEQFKEQYPQAGKDAKFVEISHADYKRTAVNAGNSEEIAEETLQTMRLINEFGYYGGADLKESHSILVDKLTTWKEFMASSRAFAGLK